MTDQKPKPTTKRTKRPDADKIAEAELRAEAIAKAKEIGLEVDDTWSAERIEDAIVKAKAAAAEAEKAPKSEPETKAEIDEDDPIRAEIMAEAKKVGMNLAELDGKTNEEALTLIGAHVTTQAVRNEEAKADAGRVSMRVLPNGDNKISKGIHVPGVGDLRYRKGDVIEGALPEPAKQLEAKGYVEII